MCNTATILHAEDDQAFGDMVTTFLEQEREYFQVKTVNSVGEGIDRLGEKEFDCVVSDYDMPGENGLDFLKSIRSDSYTVPFILFTGKGSEEIASQAISAGVTDYIQKRGDTSVYAVLANSIEHAVETHQQQKALEHERDRMSALLDTAPTPVIESDFSQASRHHQITSVNEAFEEVFGYETGEIVEKDIADVIVPDTGMERHEVFRARAMQGEAIIEEVDRLTVEGPKRFLLHVVPYGGEDGDTDGWFACYTDISDIGILGETHPDRLQS